MLKIVKKLLSLLATISILLIISAATFNLPEKTNNKLIEAIEKERHWVDSLFNAMNPDERLGQIVWLRAHTDLDEEHINALENQITKYNPGGLCFFNPSFKGTPEKQVELVNRYQALAKRVPMFMTIDGEWGLGMRYKGTALSFPRQLLLGAIQDDKLIYDMGAAIARHCRRLGITVNFAPVADVNNNPANPVIGFRSFGENPYKVAVKAYMYMKGLQDSGVLACAKHFPGHGDTDVDSHYDLPVIKHNTSRLDSVELFPFKVLINQGIGSIMVAHLQIPSLDETPNLATTLSSNVVTDLLKKKLGYQGLVMTDALEMKGVTKYHGKGEVEAKAIAAGNDVLLLPGDVDEAFATIKKWISNGKLSQNQIDQSVRKVLTWKYRMGLSTFEKLEVKDAGLDVNDMEAIAVKRKLIENALTLVRNKEDLLPFRNIRKEQVASLAIGAQPGNKFQNSLSQYIGMELFTSSKNLTAVDQKSWLNRLKGKDIVIVSLHDMSQFASREFGLTESARSLITSLQRQSKVVLVVFGNPYSLKYFDEIEVVLEAYEADDDVEDLSAQALFGAFPIRGKLPVTVSMKSPAGAGVMTPGLQTLGFGVPEEVGINSKILDKIDLKMQDAIDAGATPGGVVLVAKDGKVVFQRAYGRHTYDVNSPQTQVSDIFDLASITKIAATTISLMKLQEEGKFNLQAPVEQYLHDFASTNKAGIPVQDMLTHYARLTPWIRFYEKTISAPPKPAPLPVYYDNLPSGRFPLPVAKDLWLRADYPDSVWQEIKDSPLLESRTYRYSDLGFYIAGEIIKELSGQRIEIFAKERFYDLLGLETTTYRPYEHFPLTRIPPTEDDVYFRARRVHGYVHDMGAAMLNQATGHAGLFSNAKDLAVIMQMLLNKGYYGGRQFLKPETIAAYTTRCSSCSRRGIGFDMKQYDGRFEANISSKASLSTFGHLGFTGTSTWADPENGLVYVFLSNRTFPTMDNNKLGRINTRVLVQDIIYEALEK
jgi:beta-glucosidase-like glycosyl hydrolase/CubicO group peptidase (beta-lactamase class C family)